MADAERAAGGSPSTSGRQEGRGSGSSDAALAQWAEAVLFPGTSQQADDDVFAVRVPGCCC